MAGGGAIIATVEASLSFVAEAAEAGGLQILAVVKMSRAEKGRADLARVSVAARPPARGAAKRGGGVKEEAGTAWLAADRRQRANTERGRRGDTDGKERTYTARKRQRKNTHDTTHTVREILQMTSGRSSKWQWHCRPWLTHMHGDSVHG
uniref:Uncharacterized protein n=1 Tax=Leersia perrieri TaxID=77586 RepID=A0A0D9XHA1_9ORYZ